MTLIGNDGNCELWMDGFHLLTRDMDGKYTFVKQDEDTSFFSEALEKNRKRYFNKIDKVKIDEINSRLKHSKHFNTGKRKDARS